MLLELSVVVIGGLGVLFLSFFFMKSSKKLPSNFQEIMSELRVQHSGTTGITEDIIMRSRNVVELYNQKGRVAVLTGGNRGIGLRIVEKLIQCNITVLCGVRDPKSAKESVDAFLKGNNYETEGNIFYEKLDISNTESVKLFAKAVQEKYQKIDLLINNAGIMGAPFKITSEGFESHMAINYLGHFLLSHLLLPQIKAAGSPEQNSRIVNVSSCVHKLGEIQYDNFDGKKFYYPASHYNHSKLAQVLFTVTLNSMLEKENAHVQVHSVHPGVVDTDLFENSSTTYIPWVRKLLFKTPEEGSRTIIYAAISKKLEGKGGNYLSNCRIQKMHSMTQKPVECEEFFRFTCDLLKIKEFIV